MVEQYSDRMAKKLGIYEEREGKLFVVINEFGAVFEENIAINASCEVIVGKIRAADDHVVIEDVALDVVHAEDFVPTRWKELRYQVFGKHRRVEIDIMSVHYLQTMNQTFLHISCREE